MASDRSLGKTALQSADLNGIGSDMRVEDCQIEIARLEREAGVNTNQVFQLRYEYRNSAGWALNGRFPGSEFDS